VGEEDEEEGSFLGFLEPHRTLLMRPVDLGRIEG
jgi:hypothetical protein